MKLQKIDLETLPTEIAELPIDWMDEAARDLIQGVNETVPRLRDVDGPLDSLISPNSYRTTPGFWTF